MTCRDSTKAIGYVRVSTDEQAKSGLSIEHQKERIRAYATMAGLELVSIIEDEGVSAGKPLAQRKGGLALLEALSAEQACHVVALKLDRLFRDAADALNTSRGWDHAEVGLHLIDMGGQSINTKSAMGRMFFTLAAGFAEFERGLIRERTSAAMAVKKARGEVYCSPVLGFDAVDGRLLVNPEEQALIARIKALQAAGNSLRGIAAILNAERVPTKRGGAWFASTLHRVLAR